MWENRAGKAPNAGSTPVLRVCLREVARSGAEPADVRARLAVAPTVGRLGQVLGGCLVHELGPCALRRFADF